MNLKEYVSGYYKPQYRYKSFFPSIINHSWVWDDPKINVLLEKATQALGISERTARDLIDEMEKIGILVEVTGYKRNRIFVFKEYLELF